MTLISHVPATREWADEAAPALGGTLGDAGWRQATELPAFGLVTDGSAPAEATRAWVGHDADHLYIAFGCAESPMDKLVARPGTEHGIPLIDETVPTQPVRNADTKTGDAAVAK